MDKVIQLDTVDRYNKLYGLETLHPLVSIIDLTKATNLVNHIQMNYGVYALFLKCGKECDIKYGRKNYDYQEGTIVCFAPGQVAEVSALEDEVKLNVYGILFHPDLIRGTALGQNIKCYGFFSYSVSEALHLSERERKIIMDCFEKIQIELQYGVDKLSKRLIVMNIELLLSYCLRFYERQFITREHISLDTIQKFENQIEAYLSGDLVQKHGLPTVKYFADSVFLSPNYFGDLVKKETGKSPREYIQFKLIEHAKERLSVTELTISEIAYELGFQYPQHFGRLFKKQVGLTPNEYRKSIE
ncbi:helix-turn-helix domain-containing protein [Bacteroides reticulotermitis]|uniref:helix-turn-helix domain-containing protein n=1 Tax=Bacteroides reticulotermitis TaxID=1133319 RepID=UPI003A86ED17